MSECGPIEVHMNTCPSRGRVSECAPVVTNILLRILIVKSIDGSDAEGK